MNIISSFFSNLISWTTVDPKAKDPCKIIPAQVVVHHIFSYFTLKELINSSHTSKQWEKLAANDIVWRPAVYREIAFNSTHWGQLLDKEIVEGVDPAEEMLSLPINIGKELSRSAIPEKTIRDTHVLVIMPKGLTIRKLGEFAKKYFPGNDRGYNIISPIILEEWGDKAIDQSVWLLMTKEILPNSIGRTYRGLEETAKRSVIPFQLPTMLEAATCILAEYSRSKKRIFSKNNTYCQECFEGYPTLVSFFSSNGIELAISTQGSIRGGIPMLRKF